MSDLLAVEASAVIAEMDAVDHAADDPDRPTRSFRHDRAPVRAGQHASGVEDMVTRNRAVPVE
jgi:hypothetical protein